MQTFHKNVLVGSCIWSAIRKNQNGVLKVARKAFNIGRSGTHYVAMETELLSFYNGAHLVESYCKESNISVQIDWDISFIIFDKNLVECTTSSFG